MPRVKYKTLLKIESWQEANDALRIIAEKQSATEKLVAAHNKREAAYREVLDERCNPNKISIQHIADALKAFCTDRRDDFGKKQSKKLSNGTVSFRKGMPKSKLLSGFTWEKALDLVKGSKWKNSHIRKKEEIDKEKFINDWVSKKLDNEKLTELGFKITSDETFGYEVNLAVENPKE